MNNLIPGKLYLISLNEKKSEEIEFYFTPFFNGEDYNDSSENNCFRNQAVVMFLGQEMVVDNNWIEFKALLVDKLVYFGYGNGQNINWEELTT